MNYDILQISSLLLSISALILVVSIFFVNIYFRIRRRFPITVNCWFCNTWSKVPYENYNSFDCQNCFQYNGFTKDGSYNKIIEAQHNVTLKTAHSPTTISSNGFCESCNHNQQLKITQLASFTSLKEEDYDLEIEHFKKQLEKAYQLCKQCTRVLKFTLLREKASFFGRHVFNIQKKGINLYMKNSNIIILTNPISVRIITKIQCCVSLFLILNLVAQLIFSGDVSKAIPSFILPYFELFQDLYLLISNIDFELSCYFHSSFLDNAEIGSFEFFSLVGLTLQLILFFIESSIMSIKVNQVLCWSFLTLTSCATTQEILIYTCLFQILCATLIFYHSLYEFDTHIQNKPSFEKLRNITDNFDEYSDDELDISSQSVKSCRSFVNYTGSSKSLFNSSLNKSINSIPYYKTENNIFTSDKNCTTSINTAKNLNNITSYSNIQNSLEDLHLSNSTFRIGKPIPLPFNRSSPLSERSKLVLSPSKFKTVTQNSWVAGGFWRNEDGSIVPIIENAPLSRSSSKSSGFGSQINENLSNLNNPFSSLPTSTKNSLCGDLDNFSLTSEPAYHFQPLNPQPSWTNMTDCKTAGISTNPFCINTFRNVHKSSNQRFNEFVVPTRNQIETQMPLYSTSKPLGLFKLPQISPIDSGTHSSDLRNREFVIYPSNTVQYTMNSERF